jgi:hypothetical protein
MEQDGGKKGMGVVHVQVKQGIDPKEVRQRVEASLGNDMNVLVQAEGMGVNDAPCWCGGTSTSVGVGGQGGSYTSR